MDLPGYSKTWVKNPLNPSPRLVILAITCFVVCSLFFAVAITTTRPVVKAQTTSTTPTAAPAANNEPVNRADLLLLQAQIQNQAQQLQQAQQDALEAKNSASAAATLSLLGILFGILGIVIGALALLRGRPGSAKDNAGKSEAG